MKRMISLLLASVMLVGAMALMTACGNNNADSTSAGQVQIPEGLESNGNGTYSKFEYDKYGNVIRSYVYGPDFELRSYKAYEYDDSHQYVIHQIDYDNKDQKQQEFTYKRTPEGNILEKYRFDANGKATNVMTCEYDEQQNIIAQHNFDGDGHLLNYEKYEYENGVMVKETEYDGDGNIKYYKTFETDANGKTIEYWYKPDGTLFKTE